VVIRWDELVAEWRARLAACRDALGLGGGGDESDWSLLKMRERVLAYLVGRYGDDEPEEPDTDGPPPLPPFGSYEYYGLEVPRPVPKVSAKHPPRTAAEMRLHLRLLHQRLEDRGWWWRWVWRGEWW
jgi:hypothetical protein